MNGLLLSVIVIIALFVVLLAVWSRMRRQVGGGFGPTTFSDGHMTTTPTGYPEEMKGSGKVIGPTDNDAAKL